MSDMDYYLKNLDCNGSSMVSRIRWATQYAGGSEDFVKTIALFELGTYKHGYGGAPRNGWFGNAPGFYWGCTNTNGLQMRPEMVPGFKGKPVNVVFAPSPRDRMWLRPYDRHKGRISTLRLRGVRHAAHHRLPVVRRQGSRQRQWGRG
jgi:hypothetical protein